MKQFPRLFVLVALSLLLRAAPCTGQMSEPVDRREQRALRLFHEGDYEEARDLLLAVVEGRGRHVTARYNLACVYAQMGETEEAVQWLRQSVNAGYLNLHHLKRDSDLDPIRGDEAYQRLLDDWNELLIKRLEDRVHHMRRNLSGGYRTERDDDHRVIYLSSLDRMSYLEMKQLVSDVFDAAIAEIFGEGLDVPVLVVVPTPSDFQRMVGQSNIGGLYNHDLYQLVARTIGSNLRHELVHALHWADMDRRDQAHPIWIQEGMAALFEDVELREGKFVAKPSWRTNIVKRLARANRLTHFPKLAAYERRHFMEFRVSRNYAEARAVFMFLAAKGKLRAWYDAYTSSFDEDPSGILAMERVFGMEVAEIEDDYADWVAQLPEVQEIVTPGGASMGITVNDREVNDGIVIKDVHPGTGASRADLLVGDVIISFNGKKVRSVRELTRELGGLAVGRRVKLRIRRDGAYLTRLVELTPR